MRILAEVTSLDAIIPEQLGAVKAGWGLSALERRFIRTTLNIGSDGRLWVLIIFDLQVRKLNIPSGCPIHSIRSHPRSPAMDRRTRCSGGRVVPLPASEHVTRSDQSKSVQS